MKNLLFGVITLGILIASGSVSYYYVFFLPQQTTKEQQDISAIRSEVAPTPDEQNAAIQKMKDALIGQQQAPSNGTDSLSNVLQKLSPRK